ncbi:MAG: hypothetical protein CVV27_13165 [Candidatus Melainabacteria bacterium HGW-Melainabacteria-1]|nr:MAG: hypothetical protein CVV27_13165 [Candidatus Melainabacteria bacterium HGW-Melainabacteria-1]
MRRGTRNRFRRKSYRAGNGNSAGGLYPYGHLQASQPSERSPIYLQWILTAFQALLEKIGHSLRIALALASCCVGICLVILLVQIQQQPQLLQPLQRMLVRTGLDVPLAKFAQLASLTTRSAEAAVVRDNMERLRLMLEAFPVEGGHEYPLNVEFLYAQANHKGFWNLSRNPLTGARSFQGIVSDYATYQQAYEPSNFAGQVLYEPLGHPPSAYRIYACDKDGKLFQTKAGVFFLSNQN